MPQQWDVIVVGAGNAGLCAALSAFDAGARVLVLEKAPESERGGNTAYTGGLFRFAFSGKDEVAELVNDLSESEAADIEVGSYPSDRYAEDLGTTSEGLGDEALISLLTEQSYPTMRWLKECGGVRWVLATGRQAYRVDGKFHFFGNLILEASGGGHGLSDTLFATALKRGIEVKYDTAARRLLLDDDGRAVGVQARTGGHLVDLHASAVVLASGGFQSDASMRAIYLGAEWDLAKVRGTRYDTGDGIRMALDVGARPTGHWSSCHAVAWDAMAPATGDRVMGDLFQRHSYPIGLVVNRDGKRFLDEGANFRNYTYAKYGREILRQPGRVAFQLFDAKTVPLLRDEYRSRPITKVKANTLDHIAEEMLIDAEALRSTVEDFNAAVRTDVAFNPSALDGKSSHPSGQPPKSNWAQPLDTPPYEAYAVTCGVTFTFGGLGVDPKMAVQGADNSAIPGLFAAGELVGGLFYYNYPGGSGLMAGAVFGRQAGSSAAAYAASIGDRPGDGGEGAEPSATTNGRVGAPRGA
jgi:tricarballylate dehydrogenase